MSAVEFFVEQCEVMGLQQPYLPADSARVVAVLMRVASLRRPISAQLGFMVSAVTWAHVVKGWPDVGARGGHGCRPGGLTRVGLRVFALRAALWCAATWGEGGRGYASRS